MTDSIFLKKIGLSNYKSIKTASVSLGPLTFLVGQNGAGKSNFLDAPRLVAEALNTSLEHALRGRGGINEVRRRSSGHPTHFGIRLEWRLPDGTQGIYVFRVGAQPKGGFEVQQEVCRVYRDDQIVEACYRIENGQHVSSSDKVWPPIARDRLYLVAAAGLPEFRPLYNALSHMGFYNLDPDSIRELQPPDPGAVLKRDGSNLASVLGVLEKQAPGSFERIVEYLSRVVPGIDGVVVRQLGKKETIEFLQKVGTNRDPWRFMAENMSDGTLRALGVLTALFQSSNGGPARVPFVGIEEPEAAVHPGAAGVIRDGLRTASRTTQIAITSHSPDLLDEPDISAESILAVVSRNGETIIGPVDEAGRSAIRERLYTAGELLRMNQIEPEEVETEQLDLFAD
ncbi:MAG: AAA family ATPase [candidate division WOR-3 bacterium]|nr:AAA family ATPase [candidate division WOR-3 bacterium]